MTRSILLLVRGEAMRFDELQLRVAKNHASIFLHRMRAGTIVSPGSVIIMMGRNVVQHRRLIPKL